MFGRKKKTERDASSISSAEGAPGRRHDSDRTLTDDPFVYGQPTKAQIKRATRTRLYWSLFTSLLLFISLIFVILVEIGSTYNMDVLRDIYFIKLNLTNIIPTSVPNATLINSIARTVGLHDFYTVGLWGFCSGYMSEGTTECSNPKTLWWFNPVEIIQGELLAGATIALPADITDILDLIRTVSHWMFGLYLAGACLTALMIFLVPLSVYTRWLTFPITIFTFLAALFTTVATVIATVMFIIMRNTVTQVNQLNLEASLGIEMWAFMWIASAFAIVAWLIQFGLCCCCASRRDVKKGKKRGSKKAWVQPAEGEMVEKEEKQGRFMGFGKKKREAA